MPDEYLLFRAARYIGCSPWELARQASCWKDWALMFELAESRAQEITRNIGEQREQVATRQGKSAGDHEDDERRRADLLAQIRAQGGVIDGE